ncbi:MAG: DUF6158 family protein [Frankiaceae bacterium]
MAAGMDQGRTGIPASELSDEDLDRELTHLHETRHETFLSGSTEALKHHTDRMLELEAAYAERFPERVAPDPMRVRGTSRRAAGQDPS